MITSFVVYVFCTCLIITTIAFFHMIYKCNAEGAVSSFLVMIIFLFAISFALRFHYEMKECEQLEQWYFEETPEQIQDDVYANSNYL